MIFAQMCILEEIEMQDYSKNIEENKSKNKKNKKSKNKKKTTRKRFTKSKQQKYKKKIVKNSNLVQEKLGTNILRKIQNRGGKRAKIQKKQNFRKN